MTLSADRLKELVSYDPVSGVFTRKKNKFNPHLEGAVCGRINAEGYRIIKVDGRPYLSGRLAFLYMEGRFPVEIDHMNRVRDDDRWCNLREATHKENTNNRKGSYLGVHTSVNKHKQTRYYARLRSGGKTEYFGPYSTKKEAHEIYLQIKIQRGLLKC